MASPGFAGLSFFLGVRALAVAPVLGRQARADQRSVHIGRRVRPAAAHEAAIPIPIDKTAADAPAGEPDEFVARLVGKRFGWRL